MRIYIKLPQDSVLFNMKKSSIFRFIRKYCSFFDYHSSSLTIFFSKSLMITSFCLVLLCKSFALIGNNTEWIPPPQNQTSIRIFAKILPPKTNCKYPHSCSYLEVFPVSDQEQKTRNIKTRYLPRFLRWAQNRAHKSSISYPFLTMSTEPGT